jgi:hypothetical protein
MVRTILTLSAALVLVASGVVHGLWTDRWTANPEELQRAAERLDKLTPVIGAWDSTDIDMNDEGRLGLAGVLARRYANRETGKAISIYLACGRPGPASIHTPNACYPADGYNEVDPPQRISVTGAGTGAAEFWTARYMRQRPDGQTNLRIYWTWHCRAGWQAPDNPRREFAGQSVLHKLYVIRELGGPSDRPETDVCVEFVRELLPALEEQLFAR